MRTFSKSVSRSSEIRAPFSSDGAATVARHAQDHDRSEQWAMGRRDLHQLISNLFEEEALLLGGIVALHPVGDDVIRKLVSGLDRLRARYLERLGADPGRSPVPATGTGSAPHPAIEQFLRKVRSDWTGG
mgnify:CR=1 FL=1